MNVTVKDCLQLEAFSECTVLAGNRHLLNRVRSVSVMDAPDLATAIESNGIRDQLVLTSFYAMRGKEELQKNLVRELAKKGIAGIVVFHVKKGVSVLDRAIIETSEVMGLPFLLMSENNTAEYADVIDQVMNKMIFGDSFKNSLVNNMIYHLLNFEKHSGFPEALREASINNELQVVLLSKDFNPVLVVETRHTATVSDAVKTLKESVNKKTGMYSMIKIEGVLAYWGRITINKESYFLLIVDNEDNYSAAEITKIAEIIELAVAMWKYTPERDVKAELIRALIRGNKSLAYSLRDEIGVEQENIVSVFFAKKIHTRQNEEAMFDIEKKADIEVMRIHEGEETYGIIVSNSNKDKKKNPKAACLDLYNVLKSGDKKSRIFHSTGIQGIEGAADGFRLISETWSFVENVFPYKRVFTKYELVLVSNCINIQVHGGYLKKSYVDLLEPFRNNIGENKTKQLLATLETFVLDAGMNSSNTAEFMDIHANTVQYRLKRINDILGVEITGNRVIPGLTIALALRRLEVIAR